MASPEAAVFVRQCWFSLPGPTPPPFFVLVPVCLCVCAQPCLTLCDSRDWPARGSSVHRVFQANHWSGLPFTYSGDLPKPEVELVSLVCLLHWPGGSLSLCHLGLVPKRPEDEVKSTYLGEEFVLHTSKTCLEFLSYTSRSPRNVYRMDTGVLDKPGSGKIY